MTGDYRYIPPKPPLGFTVGILAGFGGLAGLMTAQGDTGLMLPFLAIGAALFAAFSLEVPNLIGYTYQEASNILQEIGLLPSASGDTGGRVSGQNPEEGSFLDPEGFVELSFDN